MTDERLTELETKIAFQDDEISELNAAIYEQHKQLAELRTICKSLSERLTAQKDSGESPASSDTPPPHY